MSTKFVTTLVLCGLLTAGLSAAPASADDPTQDQSPSSAQAKAPTDSDSDGSLDAPDTAAAAAGAATADKPVESLSERTESRTVVVNPDGTLTERTFAAPVRVKHDGEWIDVDYTLVEQADGSWAPKTSPVDISIDGGTAKEAARVTFDNGDSLAVTWPQDLPEPTIDGGVATYKLSSATDLLVAVTGSGVTARIRLNEQPAADDPVFTFGLRADGVEVDQTAAGGLKVTDDNGKTVGTMTQLSAWDADTDEAGDPADVVSLDAELTDVSSNGDVTKQELELTTPDGYLSDPDTTYPVVIDPDISGIISHRDMWVRANDSASHAGDYRLITGRLNGSTNTSSAMSYLQFINTQLAGKDITNAEVGLWQYHSETCADRRLVVSPISQSWTSTTDWADRPDIRDSDRAYLDANRGFSAACSNGWAKLNITDMAQNWATGAYTNYGMRLSSSGGSDESYDRRFCSRNPDTSHTSCTTASRTPYLDITYNAPPTASAGAPTVDQSAEATTKISAVVTDADGTNPWAEFTVKRGTTVVFKGLSTSGSGSTQSVEVADLPKGQYTVSARAYDGRLFSNNSTPSTTFTVAADASQVAGNTFMANSAVQVASLTVPGATTNSESGVTEPGRVVIPIAGPAGIPSGVQATTAPIITARASGWASAGSVSVVDPLGELPATPSLTITSQMAPSTAVSVTSVVLLGEQGEAALLNTSTTPVPLVVTVEGRFSVPTQVDPEGEDDAAHGAYLPPGFSTLADTPEAIAAQPAVDAQQELYALYDEKLFGPPPVDTQNALFGVQNALFLPSSDPQTLDERIAEAQAEVEDLTGLPIEEVLPEPQIDPQDASAVYSVASAGAMLPAQICSPYPSCTGESYKLDVRHSTQAKCWWCGPAATAMALRASGASNTSDANGSHQMSQTLLASSAYLKTKRGDGTWIYDIKDTLWKWASIRASVTPRPTATGLASTVRVSIKGYKRAVVYGTYEPAGTHHYNYHPESIPVWHFITGYGYYNYGKSLRYADPVSGARNENGILCFGGPVRKLYHMSATAMAGYISGFGVVARGA